jgi:hypothetical protein
MRPGCNEPERAAQLPAGRQQAPSRPHVPFPLCRCPVCSPAGETSGVGAADRGLVRIDARDRMQGPQPTFLIADPAASRLGNTPRTRVPAPTPGQGAAIRELPRNRSAEGGIFPCIRSRRIHLLGSAHGRGGPGSGDDTRGLPSACSTPRLNCDRSIKALRSFESLYFCDGELTLPRLSCPRPTTFLIFWP